MVKLSDEMAMKDHTDTVLRLSDEGDPCTMYSESGALIAQGYSNGPGHGTGNAARLVACWNACAGVETEALATGGALLIDARHFIHDEYDGLLRSVCSVVDGKPVRERIDPYSVGAVEEYEALLRRLGVYLSSKTAPEPVKPGDEGEG